jgi:hypothetical protein
VKHALGIVLVLVLLAPTLAQAKTTRVVSYRYDDVFPTALRFLRVDENLKVVEKDADAGYILFELTDGKRTFQGAVELVRTRDEAGREATRVQVRIADRPSYMELGILDRLEEKLKADLGDPAEPPPPPPSTDAGPR